MNKQIDESEEVECSAVYLLPSGFHTPEIKHTFRQLFYRTNYERQIFRSHLSSSVTSIDFPNFQYLVTYQSELQILKVERNKVISKPLKNFAAFIIPRKHPKNPQILQFYKFDMLNKFYSYDLDLTQTEIKESNVEFEGEKNPFKESLQNVIIQQYFLNANETKLFLVTDKNIQIADLIDLRVMKINNPLNQDLEHKILLQINKCNHFIIMAQYKQLFCYSNSKWRKRYLKEEIISISLYKETLLIITSKSFIKVNNIYNDLVQVCDNDYINLEEYIIKYALIVCEDCKFAILVNQNNQILYIKDLEKIEIIDSQETLLNCKSIQLIEIQNQYLYFENKPEHQNYQLTKKIRIIYFTNDDYLKIHEFTINI